MTRASRAVTTAEGLWVAGAGIVLALVLIGFPLPSVKLIIKVLWSPQAAGWAAAIGAVYAARIALRLGSAASVREDERARARAHGSALAFIIEFETLMALFELVEEEAGAFRGNVANAKIYRNALMEVPELVPPAHSALLAQLPEELAKYLVLAASAQRTARRKLTNARDERLADAIFEACSFWITSALPAANRLHTLIYGAGHAPWRSEINPSGKPA